MKDRKNEANICFQTFAFSENLPFSTFFLFLYVKIYIMLTVAKNMVLDFMKIGDLGRAT